MGSGSPGLSLNLQRLSNALTNKESVPSSGHPNQSLVNEIVECLSSNANAPVVQAGDVVCDSNCSSKSQSTQHLEEVTTLDGIQVDPGMDQRLKQNFENL